MAPDEVEEPFKVKRITYQTASPFNAPVRYASVGEVGAPSMCELDVTTKARYTYELDRYSKNAMLIFEGNSENSDTTESNSENEDTYINDEELCTKLKETFENYRFEIEVHRNLKDHEIASTCDTFFQKDFTEYGCVGIIMLPKISDGYVESYHTPNSEFGVLRYLSDLYTPTLQGKPIIYIIQTESCYVVPQARLSSRIPVDILEFRVPVPVLSTPDAKRTSTTVGCLLEYINEKIKTLGDHIDLYTILNDAVNEFTRFGQLYDSPVGFYSSLTKELWLSRIQD